MKVFISADIEGVACVAHIAEIFAEAGGEYQMARRWMTAEVNAAALGAFEAGASEVVVADSHSSFRNLLPDELHEDVVLVRGTPRPMFMMQGLDASFDAVFFIGYHARHNDPGGVLGHTFMEQVAAIRLNGQTIAEAHFNAAIAGHLGVPVALVSGDHVIAEAVRTALPWAERVVVKQGLGVLATQSLTPRKAQARIRAGARAALARLGEMQPFVLARPITLEVDFGIGQWAQLSADLPGAELIGEHSVRYLAADMLEAQRILRLMLNLTMNHPRTGGKSY
ncbi:MAG: M55 family metallopeptidase [Caldilineales bacterium]|nr:M55 family metallopeptidase [Caldilineales bacterium]MCW5857247.1 M55 family metallopeptidase [Caldilineales bacterium]